MDRIVKLHLDSCGYLPGEIAVYFGLHAIQASAFWKITFQHQVSEDLSTLKKNSQEICFSGAMHSAAGVLVYIFLISFPKWWFFRG